MVKTRPSRYETGRSPRSPRERASGAVPETMSGLEAGREELGWRWLRLEFDQQGMISQAGAMRSFAGRGKERTVGRHFLSFADEGRLRT